MAENSSFQQIYGVETEWPISTRYGDVRSEFVQFSTDNHYNQFLKDYLPDGVVGTYSQFSSSSFNFLSNGSRYYNDTGGRFEYATPEDISVESVVVSEMAGEWIVAEGLRRYLVQDNKVREAFMCRRVDGADHSTWGRHINIGEDRAWIKDTAAVQKLTRPLATHIASSLPLFGGGAVYRDDDGNYQYSYGQKVLNPITQDFDAGTTQVSSKPIINLRDEPHTDREKYWRLHVVGVDSHVSPWANKMLIGSISLVLLACREGLMDDLVFAGGKDSAARAMRVIARDMSLGQKYQLEGSSKTHTVFDIQERLIEATKRTQGRTAEQDRLLEEWEKGVVAFKQNPDEFVRSDAILKRNLVRQDLERKKKLSLDAGSRLLDIMYTAPLWATKEQAQNHTTDELIASSFAGKVRKKYFSDDMPAQIDIKDRIVNPPTTTRAYRRGKEILNYTARWKSWDEYAGTIGYGPFPRVSDPLDGAIEDEYHRLNDILE